DSASQIQNISAGSTVTVNATTVSPTQLAPGEHLCVRFWRHQTTAYTSGGATREVYLLPDDPADQVTVHPAPDVYPAVPAVNSPPSPADGAVVSSIPTLGAQYSDSDNTAPGGT